MAGDVFPQKANNLNANLMTKVRGYTGQRSALAELRPSQHTLSLASAPEQRINARNIVAPSRLQVEPSNYQTGS